MSVAPGQLWAAVPKSLFFVSRVDLGIATVVSVRVTGTGKDAKIVALGKVMRVSVEAMLEAWQRLSDGGTSEGGPTTDAYPGLVNNLFVLNHVAERDFAGVTVARGFHR